MQLLNGNQTMVIMTQYLLKKWQKAGKIDGKQFIGSTIVSTPMILELASTYNVACKVGLTGFKWIAKFIKDFPNIKEDSIDLKNDTKPKNEFSFILFN